MSWFNVILSMWRNETKWKPFPYLFGFYIVLTRNSVDVNYFDHYYTYLDFLFIRLAQGIRRQDLNRSILACSAQVH